MKKAVTTLLCAAALLSIPAHAKSKTEYVKCMAHIERLSQGVMISVVALNVARESEEGMACYSPDAGLSEQQTKLRNQVYNYYAIQLSAPSATAHTQVILAIQRFIESLDS